MSFSRKILSLGIEASRDPVQTPAILVPDGATQITAQFIYALGGDGSSVVSMEQSSDGNNFDTVYDPSGSIVSITLDPADSSATLNINNLLAQWIRFSISFAAGSTGSVTSAIILTR